MKKITLLLFIISPTLLFAQSNSLIFINPDAKCTTQDIESYGVKVNSKFKNIFTISSVNNFQKLQNCSDILFIESNNSQYNVHKMDSALKIINGLDTLSNPWKRNLKATGKGVIVGIVDIGFQPNHLTFYDTLNKKSRVSRIWQQSKKGTPPVGFNYGTEITDPAEILKFKDGSHNHGTHVAGIAAGNGLGSPGQKYAGLAPESEIVLVDIKYKNDSVKEGALGDFLVANPTILDGYKYIFDYAKSVNKPAVINLSWGMHTGPHDGKSIFDQALKNLVGKGNIIVGANGNDGKREMHLYANLKNDSLQTIIMESGRKHRKNEEIYIDIWGSPNKIYSTSIEVIDTNGVLYNKSKGKLSFAKGTYHDTLAMNDTNVTVKYIVNSKYPSNQKDNIRIEVTNNNPKRYLIRLKIFSLSSEINAWNSGGINRWTSGTFANKYKNLDLSSSHIKGITTGTNGENGGTAESVISVGALQNKVSQPTLDGKKHYDKWAVVGKIAGFSSKGPTTDGRIKPDISAPGQRVTSALNYYGKPKLKNIAYADTSGKDTTFWATFSGTSMAAPIITGVVALMLEINPKLTQKEVLEIIKLTARSNAYTGTLPNNKYGWGIIDAKACIAEAKRTIVLKDNIKKEKILIYPNPANDKVLILALKNIQRLILINSNGSKIKQLDINNKLSTKLNVHNLKPGYYTLNIRLQNGTNNYKKLIIYE